MLLKASQTLEQSTGISLKKPGNPEYNTTTMDSLVEKDQELEKYLVLLLGLQRLLMWERQLLGDIIPSTRHNEIFLQLAQGSIDMVVKEAEVSLAQLITIHYNATNDILYCAQQITSRALRNIARKRWTSSLEIFTALKNFMLLQPDIDKACDMAQRQQMDGILQKLQQTVSSTKLMASTRNY